MADVFISYCRDDRALTEALAARLLQHGLTVWWDTDLLPHESFRSAIDRELDAATAVVIIWTVRSAASLWVQAEADHALRQRKLISVYADDAEIRYIPKPFNMLHAVALNSHKPIFDAVIDLKLRQQPVMRADKLRADGRIAVGAQVVHCAHGPWFQPGNGRHEWFSDAPGAPEMVVVPALSSDGALPLAVSRFPITFDDWDKAWADDGVAINPPAGHRGRGSFPVTNVSWHDARQYTTWLNVKHRKPYRLPSEAEWEHCCRAATAAGSAEERSQDGSKLLMEVEKLPRNDWGLAGMIGCVWQWCEDAVHLKLSRPAASPSPTAAPPPMPVFRRAKGGSWMSEPTALAASVSEAFAAAHGQDYIGFRVVCTID